jgi:hypothetical protein
MFQQSAQPPSRHRARKAKQEDGQAELTRVQCMTIRIENGIKAKDSLTADARGLRLALLCVEALHA